MLWYRFFQLFLDDERGAAMAEYGLLVVLIAIITLSAVSLVGDEVSENYSTITSSIAGA